MFNIPRPYLNALGAAALGAVVFVLLGTPVPLLLGPLAGCLVAALAGAPLKSHKTVGSVMRVVLGVAIGASITPALMSDLPGYAPSLILMPVLVLLIGLIGYPLLRRIYGYSPATAYYSIMPGGLSEMLAFGEDAGGNVRTMSLIHATRVLLIVSLAPFALTWIYGLDFTAPPGAPARDVPLVQLALMVASGWVGWRVADRLGIFGSSIIGPIVATAALSLSGLITMRPPAEVMWAAQFIIGLSVGAKYSGITGAELRRDVGAGVIFSIALALLCFVFLEVVVLFSSASTVDVILAFLPGGQAEMAILAILAGADVAFVVSHHVLRMVLVIILAPIAVRLIR